MLWIFQMKVWYIVTGGKAEKASGKEIPDYHLLVYHCLDVAAVGRILIEKNPFLLKQLSRLSCIEETVLKNILLFFLALHDLGKFSESFQYVKR